MSGCYIPFQVCLSFILRCTPLLELVAFLLPVAAASGWLAASRYYRKNPHRTDALRSERIRAIGLNYSLNEKIQSTLELATGITDTGGKSIESRIALGNLFRRSGEVDRAIDLHQPLDLPMRNLFRVHIAMLFHLRCRVFALYYLQRPLCVEGQSLNPVGSSTHFF